MRSNAIGLGLILAEHLNITAEITNNREFFEISSIIYLLLSLWFIINFTISVLIIFSLVAIIGQALILFEMRFVESIHSLMWDIRTVVLDPFLCA